jgi:hypothetical protein
MLVISLCWVCLLVPWFALTLPQRVLAVADALLGMVMIDLLLLLSRTFCQDDIKHLAECVKH